MSTEELQGLAVHPQAGFSVALESGESSAYELSARKGKRFGGHVWFSDEVPGSSLAVFFEADACKEMNRQACQEIACTELGDADKEWCTGLLTQLESPDTHVRKAALLEISGLVLVLSLTSEGSEVVQRALEVARCGEEQEMLATELHGHVKELASSAYGSEVLQSCLEVMKPECCRFIPAELTWHAVTFAVQEHGCEVLCRLVEHMVGQEMQVLINELMQQCLLLCQDDFGNAVVQHLIEYGSQSQQVHICETLAKALPGAAKHSVMSTVLEKALNCACSKARDVLLEKMRIPPSGVIETPAKDTVVPPPTPNVSSQETKTPSVEDQLEQKNLVTTPKTSPVNTLKNASTGSVPITTLMIRGIPCSYSQERLLEVLDRMGFQGRYDFFYLPRKSHQSNLGYAFVNFVDVKWASMCSLALNGRALDVARSKKVLSVCPAHIQGLKGLKRHFKYTCVAKTSDRGPVFPKTATKRQEVFPQVAAGVLYVEELDRLYAA